MARLSLPSLRTLRASIAPELKSALFLVIALTGSVIIAVIIGLISAQPQIPLYYSLAQSAQQLAPKSHLFLFAGLSLSITIFHFSFIMAFRQLDLFLLRLFAWTTVLTQGLLLVAIIRILFVIS